MNDHARDLVYLNASHLDSLGLDMSDVVDLLEEVFRYKAAGDTLMPPKMFFYSQGNRFYSAMASCCPPLGYAGAKWQSGDPGNPSRGLPSIQGLFVLNEHESGRMAAVMDSGWITARRTAAASALVARYQAREGAQELALLGCGVQGRAHLEAMAAEVASLALCRAYDTVPERQRAFVREMDGRFGGVRVEGAGSAESALRGADIVVSGGPIRAERRASIVPEWIRPGSADRRHRLRLLCHRRVHRRDGRRRDRRLRADRRCAGEGGKFLGVTRIDADNGELIAHGKGRRRNAGQRILAFNLGIALEDVATAAEALRRAKEKGAGIRLPA